MATRLEGLRFSGPEWILSRRRALALGGAFALATLAACSESTPGDPTPADDGVSDPDGPTVQLASDDPSAAAYLDGRTGFALDLMRSAFAEAEGNAAFSPLSVTQALAIAAQGAVGKTLDEMTELFGVQGAADLAAGANAELTAMAALQQAEMSMANTAFFDKQFVVKPDYSAVLAEYFGVAPHTTSFQTDPEAGRAAINEWVSQRTKEKIPELLQAGQITPDTRAVLVNALYLKAKWASEFPASRTSDDPFHAETGAVMTEFMSIDRSFPYAASELGTAVAIPYQDDGLQALLLMPDDGKLADVTGSISAESLQQVVDQLTSTELALSVPKFEIRQRFELSAALSALGMPTAFAQNADFSNLSDEWTNISAVQHEAWLKIDEEGTEGAAATAIVGEAGSAPGDQEEPLVVTFDRPFLFLVREVSTGALIFTALVADPSQ